MMPIQSRDTRISILEFTIYSTNTLRILLIGTDRFWPSRISTREIQFIMEPWVSTLDVTRPLKLFSPLVSMKLLVLMILSDYSSRFKISRIRMMPCSIQENTKMFLQNSNTSLAMMITIESRGNSRLNLNYYWKKCWIAKMPIITLPSIFLHIMVILNNQDYLLCSELTHHQLQLLKPH